jgi:hypothetical protein
LINAQKITVRKLTYSQKPYRAPQKENIFCGVYANLKCLILIGSFFGSVRCSARKAAWDLGFGVSRGFCSQSYPQALCIVEKLLSKP